MYAQNTIESAAVLWSAEFVDIAPRAVALPGPPVGGAPIAFVTLTPSADAQIAATLDNKEPELQQPEPKATSVSVEHQQPGSSPVQDSGALPPGNSVDPGESNSMQIFSHGFLLSA